MARYEFSWIDDDGSIFKRFARALPVEAWLEMRDLDNPTPDEAVIVPVKVARGTRTSMEDLLRLVTDAVNVGLRYAEPTPVLVVPEGESSVGDPIVVSKLGPA